MKRNLLTCAVTVMIACSTLLSGDQPSQNQGYVRDTQGRTLIFRAAPSKVELGLASFFGLVGGLVLVDAIHPFKTYAPDTLGAAFNATPGQRCVMGAIGGSFTAYCATAIYSYFYHHSRMNKPLIILDQKGIWHESWGTLVAWNDIKDIKVIRKKYIINGVPVRSSQLTLNTDKRTLTIDEFQTQLGKQSDWLLLQYTHGLLFELIGQYYRTHKKN